MVAGVKPMHCFTARPLQRGYASQPALAVGPQAPAARCGLSGQTRPG